MRGTPLAKGSKLRHGAIIAGIMACGMILYYAELVPLLTDLASSARIVFARYSAHRILSFLPVVYATLVFRLRGGLLVCFLVAVLLLPRAIISAFRAEELLEVAAFFAIGALVSYIIDGLEREQERRQRAIEELESAQSRLLASVSTVRRQQQHLSSLNAVATLVNQTLDLDTVLRDSLDKGIEVMGGTTGWIYLRDEETGDLVLSAHRGLDAAFIARNQRVGPGQTLAGGVLLPEQPRIIADDEEFARRITGRANPGVILVAPLRSKGRTEGRIGIIVERPLDESARDELDLLEAIGNQIGIAVENARLYQRELIVSQQLRLSEASYRGLFENASEAIFVCAIDGQIVAANTACERLTGYTRAELAQMYVAATLSEASRKDMADLLVSLASGDTVTEPVELRLFRNDGTEAIVDFKASPIVSDGRAVGFQGIARDVTEERRLRSNMQFYITQITRAQENERLRIARELHDDTAQGLISLSRRIDILAADSDLSPNVAESLEDLRQAADNVLQGVRRYSQDLRPSILDDLGLVPALEWLVADLGKQTRIAVTIGITGEPRRLPPETELAVFRIAQEALSNVRRHSGATAVDVSVEFGATTVVVIVKDNGAGFEVPSRIGDLPNLGKLGIVGMRERARLVGGTIVIRPGADTGTTVILTVPI